jgi:hypothetical protein
MIDCCGSDRIIAIQLVCFAGGQKVRTAHVCSAAAITSNWAGLPQPATHIGAAAAGSPSLDYITREGPYKGPMGYTLFHWMLPYIEQDNVFKALIPSGPVYAGTQYHQVIKTYLCPMDPSISNGMSQTFYAGANEWAAGCYAGNYLVFGNPTAANDAQGRPHRLRLSMARRPRSCLPTSTAAAGRGTSTSCSAVCGPTPTTSGGPPSAPTRPQDDYPGTTLATSSRCDPTGERSALRTARSRVTWQHQCLLRRRRVRFQPP